MEQRRAPLELRHDPNPGFLRGSLHFLYDLAWWLAILVASPWLLWRMLRGPEFRRMVRERLGEGLSRLPPAERPRVLVHGVSVGEAKAALPIVRAIEAAYPELEVVISTTTNTGQEVARGLFPDNHLLRFPADPSIIVSRFLDRVDPGLVLLVELEVWPNFLRICNRRGIPVAVVNGRITELSHTQYVLFRDVLPQFNRISLFCVQLEEYAERFRKLHVAEERIVLTGNVKVDGLESGPVDPGDELRRMLGSPAAPVVVAGSTHEPEERLLAQACVASGVSPRLVLAPRHPHRCEEVATTLEREGHRVQRLSRLREREVADTSAIAIVDTIGELEQVYGLADLVFVGGSLIPHGGHNMLEPAAQGKAVVFGPHVTNFAQEALLLESVGGCLRLEEGADLGRVIARLLEDEPERKRMGAAAMRAVESQRGATAKTVEALEGLSLRRIAGG